MTSDARRDRSLTYATVTIASGVAAGTLVLPNDLFSHLAIAREIWHHGFPGTDPFAFSTSEIAWSPPEWLGDMAYGAAYVSLGFAGTTLLTLAAIAVCFGAITRAARTVAPAFPAALAVLLFAWPAAVQLPMRPLVLGDALLAIVIERMFALRNGDARGVRWLPALFVLWTNVHPSWPVGIAIVWMHALVLLPLAPYAARLGLVVEPLDAASRRALVVASTLSPLAVLLRPDGFEGARYPMREIVEWLAPDFAQPTNLALLVLIALSLVALLTDRTRVRALDVALVMLGAAMALRDVRFLPLAAFTCAPVLARGLVQTRIGAFTPSLLATRIALALGVVLALVAAPSSRELAADLRDGFPVQAVRWARSHHVRWARAFNTFEDGGYLLFHATGHRVFIDSRFDLYARAGVFDDYLALRRGERIAEIVDRYRFDAAFVPTAERDENFAALEAALPGLGFTMLHADEATHLWTRRVDR